MSQPDSGGGSARLDRLDLNLFRVFDCVYRERNLTRAAAVLHLSQSAVSHSLARLRRQLGDPLFVREGAGVVPTPLAERLANDIGEALALLRQTLQRSHGFDPVRDLARVTVAMSDTLEPAVLPAVVAHLRGQNPQVEVLGVRLERASLRTDLAAGRIDLAVDVAQPTPEDVHHRLLWRDEFCVLAARRRRLDAPAYLAARHVTVSSRRSGPTVEDIVLNRLGFQRTVAVRCQSYESAAQIAADSDLLLTLPRRYAMRHRAALEKLHLLALPLDVPPLELHLYWHRQADNDPGNRWLREQLLALSGQR